ncbi:MAG: hypothetical protein AB1696_28380 [Planctomycetota bacterium]
MMNETPKNDNEHSLLRCASLGGMALLSGGCALMYEVLYMRALTTVLGDMFYVHAALLSTFLIGIGLGAKCAHRFRPWLFLMEIGTGLYALALPWALGRFAEMRIAEAVTARPLWTIAATSAFLAMPSLLIGFSIPLFSDYLKRTMRSGLAFQRVYVVYNLGALLSILAVEFVLVRHLGIRRSLALAGGMNLLIGVGLYLMRFRLEKAKPPEPAAFAWGEIAAVALGSFASAVFQMFFLKLTYLVFGPHRENFAIAIAVTMGGLCLGAWGAAISRIRFSTVLLLVGVVVGATYTAYLPMLLAYQAVAPWASGSETAVVVRKLAAACAFALPAMCLFGAMLPALMRRERAVAEESGELLFVSSLANAAGYLFYVCVAHALLPGQAVLGAVAFAGLAGSALAARLRWSRGQWAAAGAGALLVGALLLTWQERDFYLAQWADELKPEDEVIVFKSGAESATLLRSRDYEWVSYNGHPSIYVTRKGVPNSAEITSGVIAALTAPRLGRALVLGFGTGLTGGTVAQYFEETDLVEINEAFYRMMPELRHVNLGVEENPRAKRILGDGRTFLAGRRDAYDVIVNSIPAPTYFSASKIYTVEFYERVAGALRPDGVFCTWLSAPDMSEEGVMTVLAALRRQFPYCHLRLLNGSYYMAACSRLPIHPRRFRELPSSLPVEAALLKRFPDPDLDHFFEDIRLSDNIFRIFTPQVARENTDDFPALEFMLVRRYQTHAMGGDPFAAEPERFNINPLQGIDLKDAAQIVERAGVYYRLGSRFFEKTFSPLLKSNPATKGMWDDWLARHKPVDEDSPRR